MKKLLMSSLFTSLIIIIGSFGFTQTLESPHFTLESIGEGIYAAIHKAGGQSICNGGFVDLGDHVLVFDSFLSIAAAKDLKQAVGELAGKPVRWVVNSHSHNDHIRGNQVFVPGASIISSKEIREYLVNHGEEEAHTEQSYAPDRLSFYRQQLKETDSEEEKESAHLWIGYFEAMVESYPDLVITPPDIAFTDSITFYGSKRAASLIEFHLGHMESDIVLYLPDEQILFAGDLVFIEMHPYLADGNPFRLKQTLTELMNWPIKLVVSGHGKVGGKEDIQAMISYIDMALSLVATLKSRGKKPEDFDMAGIPEPFKNWQFSMFFHANLKFLYDLDPCP